MPDLASKPSLPKPTSTSSTKLSLPPLADATPTKAGPKPMDEWRQAAAGKRPWFRRDDGSVAQKTLAVLKTLAWLAPLTLLIWIYAERQQTATRTAFPLPIAAPRDTGKRIYRIVEPDSRTLLVDLSGPQAGLDHFTDSLGSESRGSRGITITPPEQAGYQLSKISVLDQLNEDPEFKRYGISVRSCAPDKVLLEVDDLVEMELRIEQPEKLNWATDPTFSPATVKVTAPSRIFKQARDDQRLYVTTDLAERFAKVAADPDHHVTDPPGPEETLPALRVIWPYGENGKEHVQFSAATVSATVVFRSREATYTIPAVGVQPTALVSLLNDYAIECPERVTNVQVAGPPEAIELLKSGQYRELKARLEISPDDQAQVNVPLQRPLKFDLPNGVRVQDAKKYEITFQLKRRERGV